MSNEWVTVLQWLPQYTTWYTAIVNLTASNKMATLTLQCSPWQRDSLQLQHNSVQVKSREHLQSFWLTLLLHLLYDPSQSSSASRHSYINMWFIVCISVLPWEELNIFDCVTFLHTEVLLSSAFASWINSMNSLEKYKLSLALVPQDIIISNTLLCLS